MMMHWLTRVQGRPRLRILSGAGLVFWAAAVCSPAAAQSVAGDVVAEESGRPLQAALVGLVDSAGQRQANVLTDSAGHFVLRAPAPGRYRVLLTHIGRTAVRSEELALVAGATARVRLEAPISPLLLKPIVVDARSRCKVRPEAGELVTDLWEEARKAMAVADVARGVFRGVVRGYKRTLDASSLKPLQDSTWQETTSAVRAFGSVSEAELDELGYVRPAGRDWVFFAPDERVLQSDGFMDHHCLRPVKTDRDHAGLVGVAFQPVHDAHPDIEGVAWLDATTAELRFVEFHYTSLPWVIPPATQGGRVSFGRARSGAVVVTGWYLRMPELQSRASLRPGVGGLVVLRVMERGGEAEELR